MKVVTIGLDLAKHIFQIHGADAEGRPLLRRRLRRSQVTPAVERQLGSTSYDCVVIGAGLRLPPRSLSLFEAVINAVHKAAPGAAIAFNSLPGDSADAAVCLCFGTDGKTVITRGKRLENRTTMLKSSLF